MLEGAGRARVAALSKLKGVSNLLSWILLEIILRIF